MSGEHEKAYRNRAETQEAGRERQENKEEALEKKMGAKERAEKVVRETKTTQNQIQNIVANMQAVVAAVAAIRAQLQIASGGESGSSIPSVQRDSATLAMLQKKLQRLRGQLTDIQAALCAQEENSLRAEHPDWGPSAVAQAARQRVADALSQLGIERDA